MPGIFGYASTQPPTPVANAAMAKDMFLYDHFIADKSFSDQAVYGSRVHLGHVGEKSSPFVCPKTRVAVWVEGEAYNHHEVAKSLGLTPGGFAETLVAAYSAGKLDSFLHDLDAYFCAAIYDPAKRKVLLVSDRYGMRMLYWYCRNGLFAWAGEVKGILALPQVDKTIDATSLSCFMDLGYLVGEHTWFEHIRLIKPATVLEYHIDSRQVTQRYYWTWGAIKPSKLSFDDAVDALHEVFMKSVRRRFSPDERIGISLSGGFDSRAIFAAVNKLYPEYEGYAYTFGVPGCDDIRIAEQVVARTRWQHEKFYFTADNWFIPRIEMIWSTDGMMDMMHMHGGEFSGHVCKHIHVNLNGYGGGLMTGELVPEGCVNHRVDDVVAHRKFGRFARLDSCLDEFYSVPHVEPYIYMNRNRRFTNMGTCNGLVRLEQRKPIMDKDVFGFLMSLPDEYRMGNRLYATMLQKFFPKFFLDIPWQKTGKLVNAPPPSHFSKFIQKGMRVAKKRIFRLRDTKAYTDYPQWIREPAIASLLAELLDPAHSLYRQITEDNWQLKHLQPHLNSRLKNHSNQILRAATIEIYLRQVNNEKIPAR